MIEDVAAVNLTRQRQQSQFTQFGEDTPKGGKVVTNRVVKHVFNVGEITHILEIVQQKAKNAINAKRKVILKDATDQR